MLFCGFDKALMPTLRGKIDYDGLLKAYEQKEEKPEECAMYTGALLMGKLIKFLSLKAREQALYALQNKDASSRFFLGYNTMVQVANGWNVLQESKDLLVYQIIGTLRGLNQDQIGNLRHQSDVKS